MTQPQRPQAVAGPEARNNGNLLRAVLDGDRVAAVELPAGGSHQGVEKTCELHSYTQDLLILERYAGLGPQAHTWAFCRTMEELAGVEIPARAEHIRLIVAELERLHCHLLWLAGTAREVSYDALNMDLLSDRELVLDCLAEIGGNRVKYSVNVPGGVRRDLDEHACRRIEEMLAEVGSRIGKHGALFYKELMLVNRLRGAGALTAGQAAAFGAVGPLARGTGLARDVRANEPYGLYRQLTVRPAAGSGGDAYSRTMVHLDEMEASIALIRQAVAELPQGPLTVALPRRIPAGEVLCRVEAPRGELVYFLRTDGGDTPERLRVFTPREANLYTLEQIITGSYLANVPLLLTDYDFSFGSTGRAVVVYNGEEKRTVGWEELRDFSRDYYLRQETDGAAAGASRGRTGKGE